MWSIIISLTIICTHFSLIEGAVKSADVTNATGEYYFLDDVSPVLTPSITCGAAVGCYIECKGVSACLDGSVDASATTSLTIRCISDIADAADEGACEWISLTSGPSISADIDCIGDQSCSQAQFTLTNTNNVNVLCNKTKPGSASADGACYDSKFYAQSATNFNVDCVTRFDCYYAKFFVNSISGKAIINIDAERAFYSGEVQAASAASAEVNCNGDRSCVFANIYTPYSSQYQFSLTCADINQACNSAKVHVGSSSFQNNFMTLSCPNTATALVACGVTFECNGNSNIQSKMVFNAGNSRYECDDQDCCPWTNFDDMVTTTTTAQPTKAPITLQPTDTPTTSEPTKMPSNNPSKSPTKQPSITPTTTEPTKAPSFNPTTNEPTKAPSSNPSSSPTKQPSKTPTSNPTTSEPTKTPSANPSSSPTLKPTQPPLEPGKTHSPSKNPTAAPTQPPTTAIPTNMPSVTPTKNPTGHPSISPTKQSSNPSVTPSSHPSSNPSKSPSTNPTKVPSKAPTAFIAQQTGSPSATPSKMPSAMPSMIPTAKPNCGNGGEGCNGITTDGGVMMSTFVACILMGVVLVFGV